MNRHERRALGIKGTDAASMAEGHARLARLAGSTQGLIIPSAPDLITPPTPTPSLPAPTTTLQQKAEATGHLRDFEELTLPAFARLRRNLEGYGNVLSTDHARALMCIVARFTLPCQRS